MTVLRLRQLPLQLGLEVEVVCVLCGARGPGRALRSAPVGGVELGFASAALHAGPQSEQRLRGVTQRHSLQCQAPEEGPGD